MLESSCRLMFTKQRFLSFSSPFALFDNNNGDIFIDQYTQYTCAYFDR